MEKRDKGHIQEAGAGLRKLLLGLGSFLVLRVLQALQPYSMRVYGRLGRATPMLQVLHMAAKG